MNYCQTNPIYVIFRPKTTIMIKNEPNRTQFSSAILFLYPIGCSLDVKYLGVLCALGGYEQKISNEPNFKITKINLTLVEEMNYEKIHLFSRWQNEPNLSHDLSIVACLPCAALAKEGRQRRWNPISNTTNMAILNCEPAIRLKKISGINTEKKQKK